MNKSCHWPGYWLAKKKSPRGTKRERKVSLQLLAFQRTRVRCKLLRTFFSNQSKRIEIHFDDLRNNWFFSQTKIGFQSTRATLMVHLKAIKYFAYVVVVVLKRKNCNKIFKRLCSIKIRKIIMSWVHNCRNKCSKFLSTRAFKAQKSLLYTYVFNASLCHHFLPLKEKAM